MRALPRHAITLIDIVIVLCLLAFCVLPLGVALVETRERADKMACGSNLRQIGQAMHRYAIDHGGDSHEPGIPLMLRRRSSQVWVGVAPSLPMDRRSMT